MKTIGVQRGVGSLVIAVGLLLQPFPATALAEPNAHATIEVTFTKWRTAVLPPSGVQTRSLFTGTVAGDLGAGDMVAEVLGRQASTPCTAFAPPCTPGITPPTIAGSIVALDAIYEVQVGDHSFTALIQGGSNGITGAALLDGVILAGWRTGARVHVTFQTTPNCAGSPTGPCFQGVIGIERGPEQ